MSESEEEVQIIEAKIIDYCPSIIKNQIAQCQLNIVSIVSVLKNAQNICKRNILHYSKKQRSAIKKDKKRKNLNKQKIKKDKKLKKAKKKILIKKQCKLVNFIIKIVLYDFKYQKKVKKLK